MNTDSAADRPCDEQSATGGRCYQQQKEETTAGCRWDGAPALLLVALRWAPERPRRELSVTLVAHFQPVEIPVGTVVKTTLYIGCSGASFLLDVAGDGLIKDCTRESRRGAEREVTTSTKRSLSLKPKLSGELHVGASRLSPSLELGYAASSDEMKSRSKFESRADVRLTNQCYAERHARWSYDMERVTPEVRDYLDETLELETSIELAGRGGEFTVEGRGQAKDRTFFGADRKRLSGLASLALYARLKASGVCIPEPGPAAHRLSFEATVE